MTDADVNNIDIDINDDNTNEDDTNANATDDAKDDAPQTAQISVRIRRMLPWEDPIDCLEVEENAVCVKMQSDCERLNKNGNIFSYINSLE